MKVGGEEGSDGKTCVACFRNRTEEYDGLWDVFSSLSAFRDEWDK
jgi:hypothetical protein